MFEFPIVDFNPMANIRKKRSDVVELWKRQLGAIPPRTFALRAAASEDLVLRLSTYKKLQKHRGCVNTVSFSADGDILVSGSDDRMIILWDWNAGRVNLSFHSGHHGNVFQAKIMPCSDGRSIVSCAADGQVRHALIPENTIIQPTMLSKHGGRAHKLAIEPGSPHIFYTCAEDGLVQHFDLRTGTSTKLFTCKSFVDKSLCVPLHTIAIDPRNPNLFAVGGSDEYARVYDIRKYNVGEPADCFCPPHLIGDDLVGITGLAFSGQSELLVSYGDEHIYLFPKSMGLGAYPSHDVSESEQDPEILSPQVYEGHSNCRTVKGVTFFGPRDEYVASGSDCGRIFIWRKKGGEVMRVMEADSSVVNCIEPHPHVPLLASSGIEDDIKIWTPSAYNKSSLPVKVEQVLKPDRIACYAFNYVDDDDDDDDYMEFFDGDNGVDFADMDDNDSDDDDDDEDEDDNEEEDDDDDPIDEDDDEDIETKDDENK